MVTISWVGILASVALVTSAQEACAAHDETCLLQVSSSLAVKRGGTMPENDEIDLSKIPARGIRLVYDEHALLDSAWSGSYLTTNTTTEEGKCPFGAEEGIGKITIGVIYNRRVTVNKAVAKKLGGKETDWLVTKVGKAARSGALAKKFGADYSDINKQIIDSAGPLIISGVAGAHITMVAGRSVGCNPHDSAAPCPEKHGAVLMEFLVCGPSAKQEPAFQCCNVFGGETDKDASRVRGWARGVGDWLFGHFQKVDKAIAHYRGEEHLGIVGGKIFDALTNALPGQLMAGLEEKEVGQPNVVVWTSGLKDGMFEELALADPAEITAPMPDCPSAEMCPKLVPKETHPINDEEMKD